MAKPVTKRFSWRKIPHPHYGEFGGAMNKCESKHKHKVGPDGCPLPIDKLDGHFRAHDVTLDDWKLAKGIWTTNPFKLKEKPVYAQAYWLFSGLIFTVSGGIKKIIRRK